MDQNEIKQLEDRRITIPGKDWGKISAWLATPPRRAEELPRLVALARMQPTWER
jgi:hypothetical protein